MAYDAKIIEIIIASPSDVIEERKIIREVIAEWNAVHARDRFIVLLPLGWDTHSSPELSTRPQQLINERILEHADILVGVFWKRVGSPTGKAISGSIEEIEEHHRKGKPVMLYFSNIPVPPDTLDQSQYNQLTTFKNWAKEKGLIEFFESRDDFRQKFSRQLQLILRENAYLKSTLARSEQSKHNAVETRPDEPSLLSEDARSLGHRLIKPHPNSY